MISPKKALVAMSSTSVQDSYAAKAIDIQYSKKENGSWNFENVIGFRVCSFEEWVSVPFREGLDHAIHSAKLTLRCPTVITTTNYSKMPMRRFRPTKSLLYSMQDGRCAYSGKKMSIKAMNLEHRQPKSRGGKSTFQNLIVVDSKINSARGNKSLKEVGLRSLFNHKEPMPIPVAYTIKDIIHPDWSQWIVLS